MKQLLLAMFDTSVYGFLATTQKELVLKIIYSKNVIVYGCKVVRDELRKTPAYKKTDVKNLRIKMLNTYDLFVKKHDLPVSDIATYLALEYLKEYTGGKSKDKLYNDFMVVAIASLKNLDIVCTEDNESMTSKLSIKAYEKVNKNNHFRTSDFIGLNELKSLL